MLGLAGVPSAIQFVGFMFMPESPRWLLSKGHVDNARAVLSKTLDAGIEQVEYEVSQIQASVDMIVFCCPCCKPSKSTLALTRVTLTRVI